VIATAEQRDSVGPYRLIKAIGAGGSARIDLARIDRAYGFQRHVVVKRPLEHLREDTRAAASLRREARIGGLLRHPHLVAVLDAGTHDGYDFLVLEYVHGASLRTLMQAEAPGRVRPVPLDVALALVTDVARGLHHAHELLDEQGTPLGLVHRDVSPGNILVGFDGSVKLADFGIAKETRVATLSGSMHGTVTYMAPEQCRGHAFDRRADVFSLGVILYELVTGTRLFWADNDVASLHRVLSGTVPRPRKLVPQIPPALENVILTAVAHEPERRFPSTRAVADAIEQIAGDLGVVLGARWIARWVESVLGPRDVPWIGATTTADASTVTRGDGSLVELISTIASEGDDIDPAFGPTDPHEQTQPDHADAAARAVRSRGRRTYRRPTVIATALVATLALGAATFIVLDDKAPSLSSSSSATPVPPPAAAGQAQQPDTGQPDTARPDTGQPDTGQTGEPDTGQTGQPDTGQRRTSKRATTKPGRKRPTKESAPEPPPPAPPSVPAMTGSGATATKPNGPKPKWDPTLLLPSDSGSGTRKR
jgi:eukaryotic-like serine/threonine-protein kinase